MLTEQQTRLLLSDGYKPMPEGEWQYAVEGHGVVATIGHPFTNTLHKIPFPQLMYSSLYRKPEIMSTTSVLLMSYARHDAWRFKTTTDVIDLSGMGAYLEWASGWPHRRDSLPIEIARIMISSPRTPHKHVLRLIELKGGTGHGVFDALASRRENVTENIAIQETYWKAMWGTVSWHERKKVISKMPFDVLCSLYTKLGPKTPFAEVMLEEIERRGIVAMLGD